MARARQREHRIATDLQAALLPEVPKTIPGLSLGTYMQPALEEAEIGGDFVDVFPLDKQHYALVVGDVSGKGLAAAGQLATIRNSLRMSLYQTHSASSASNLLNSILVAHNLLNGFVTAFVCLYDASLRTITYTCCGHEPVLLRRAAGGEIEMLAKSGIPLGVNSDSEYTEHVVHLLEGDELLLYTDGLSESGPDRSHLLGTDGLTAIFANADRLGDTTITAAAIVAEAQTKAKIPFRDDVCVLFARATRS